MTFVEDYKTILKNGTWTNFGAPPTIIEDWEAEEPPDEGLRLAPADVEVEDGTASNGDIIFEEQEGTITFWASNKATRLKMENDIKSIIKASGDNGIITSKTIVNFLDKNAMEIRVKRIV